MKLGMSAGDCDRIAFEEALVGSQSALLDAIALAPNVCADAHELRVLRDYLRSYTARHCTRIAAA